MDNNYHSAKQTRISLRLMQFGHNVALKSHIMGMIMISLAVTAYSTHCSECGNTCGDVCPVFVWIIIMTVLIWSVQIMTYLDERSNASITKNNVTENVAYDVTKNVADDVTKNVADDVTKNVADDVTKNAADDVTKNAADDVTKNIANNITENAADDVTKNVADDVTKNVADDVTKNVTDEVTKNVTDDVAKNITNNITKNAANNVTKNITDGVAKNITDGVAKNITNGVTKNITNNITKNAANDATTNVADDVTKNVADDVTKNVADDVTKNIADNVTKNITDGVTTNITNGVTTNITDGVTTNITNNGVTKVATDVVIDNITRDAHIASIVNRINLLADPTTRIPFDTYIDKYASKMLPICITPRHYEITFIQKMRAGNFDMSCFGIEVYPYFITKFITLDNHVSEILKYTCNLKEIIRIYHNSFTNYYYTLNSFDSCVMEAIRNYTSVFYDWYRRLVTRILNYRDTKFDVVKCENFKEKLCKLVDNHMVIALIRLIIHVRMCMVAPHLERDNSVFTLEMQRYKHKANSIYGPHISISEITQLYDILGRTNDLYNRSHLAILTMLQK